MLKKNPTETPEEKIEQSPTPQKEYLEIQIPRISFKDTKINAYLVTALILFAFFLGMLTNKVLFLEDALKSQATLAQAIQTANANSITPTPAPSKVDVGIGHLPTLGGNKAKVTVIGFSDFQCPFCERFESATYPELYDTYIKTNKIKFAFRHYPLTTIHTNAQKAAEASECANEQTKFWEYQKLLFKNQTTWSPQLSADAINSFVNYAAELGLNTDQFRSCLDTNKYAENVQKDITEASIAGVDGTPAFFINGRILFGAQPFEQFQQIIEEELKK